MKRTSVAIAFTVSAIAIVPGCANVAAPVANVAPVASREPAPPGEFLSLFDGRALGKWLGDTNVWSVSGGKLRASVSESTPGRGKPSYLVYSGQTFSDFELHFSYRIAHGEVNSGIQYRSRQKDDGTVDGYQADIDTANKWTGILVEMNQRKFLAMRGERTETTVPTGYEIKGKLSSAEELATHISPDGWNEYVVIAHGSSLKHIINGFVMAETNDLHPDAARNGILAFQMNTGHPGEIEFKDIRLRPLAPGLPSEPTSSSHGERLWFDREVSFTGDRMSEANPVLDWTSPVDYVNGSLELRFVVSEKTTEAPVWIELVMWKSHMGGEHSILSCLPPLCQHLVRQSSMEIYIPMGT
jgi:hypothetical protein